MVRSGPHSCVAAGRVDVGGGAVGNEQEDGFMVNARYAAVCVIGMLMIAGAAGCATERAFVAFSYVVEPAQEPCPGSPSRH